MAYETTDVPVSRSQEHIRDLLRKYGAQSVNFGERFHDDGAADVGVEFVAEETLVRIFAPISAPDQDAVALKARRSRSKSAAQVRAEMTEQEARRIWRVLHWAIKARMESIENDLETFQQAFLAHLVDPKSGRTLWDHMHEAIDAGAMRVGAGGLLALNSGR